MKNKEKYKKIGLAFVSFFLMVSIAGYINYRYDPEREKNLGQTVYVSTNNDEVKIYEEEKEPVKDIEQEDTVISKYREDRHTHEPPIPFKPDAFLYALWSNLPPVWDFV